MAWRAILNEGIAYFEHGYFEEALVHMNQAADLESSNFVVYDSRAVVHEKLGNIKAALLDSKRVIDLAPNRWRGYARSAHLFDLLGKHTASIKMVDHALNHLPPEDVRRHAQLVKLREKAVTAQADAEKQRVSQVAGTSYLFGRLPVETLVEIFTVLINRNHTWAIKLSHVCGHWRRILLNTPSAWQTLVISHKHPLQKVKIWKERAKNRIARISFTLSKLHRTMVLAQLQDLPWDDVSNLRISGEGFTELRHMISDASPPHTFSKLDELSIFNWTSPDQLACLLSGPSWKLRTLCLSGSINMKDEWWQRVQQLKELHLTGPVTRFSTSVFSANRSLERFALNCPRIWHSDLNLGGNIGPTSMENLKIIECHGVTHPFQVLRVISTPSITHFSMSFATVADVPLFHIASRSSLVHLHIANCCLSTSTLPILLSSTPNLETLQIIGIQAVVNEMFRYLTPNTVCSLHGLPCRALRHIDVSQCSDLTTSSVYAFVKTRTQYASESVGLTERCAVVVSLKVDGCPNIEPDMLPWFRSKVARFSCIYATRRDLTKSRRQYP